MTHFHSDHIGDLDGLRLQTWGAERRVPLKVSLPNGVAERAFLAGVSEIRPAGWLLGRDGTLIRLPGRSNEVEQTELD